MHGDIALNGCEVMVGKSTLHLVFDWVGSINGTTSNKIARFIKMVKKICVGYQKEGIDPPSGEKPAYYCSTPFWSNLIGGSEPDPGCSNTTKV